MGVIKRHNYFKFNGHIEFIFKGTKRYWGKNVQFTVHNLKEQARLSTSNYQRLYNEWKDSNYSLEKTPMITKYLLKQPYTLSNTYWTTFGQTGVDQQKRMRQNMEDYIKKLKEADALMDEKKKKKRERKNNVQTESAG